MRRFLVIAALVFAGEMVFGLPFHTGRFFRPTLLEVFGFTNTQLGDLFAVYGVTAMLTYFPGGALADHFSARKLIALSLVSTAVGGLYMATIPGAVQMAVLYGFWGVTTIFLFWGALIRSTREWGGESSQGAAFGILESGRGLAAALGAAVAVAIFALLMPEEVAEATDAQRRAGFQAVIYWYSTLAVAAAALVWFVLPEPESAVASRRNPVKGMLEVMARPVVWAQALIIVCAYCFYKGAENWSLYAVQVLGMDEVAAAKLTAIGAYIRPVAALTAGLIADRFNSVRTIGALFILLLLSSLALSVITPDMVGLPVLLGNVFVSLFGVFALRGVYFALLEETRTPKRITGAAVGMISVVGFTPEIFFSPIAGRILDATPGVGGHLNLFKLLAVIALIGALVVVWLIWMQRNKSGSATVSSDSNVADAR